MSKIGSSVIYVDIASLLDLRQGFLATETGLSLELGKYLVSNEYNYRAIDDFSRFTTKNYRESMVTPPKEYMKNSLTTYIIAVLTQKLNNSEAVDKSEGVITKPVLWINIYPFTLTEKEKEVMQECVFIRTGRKFTVDLISVPIEQVTPMFLKESTIRTAIFYNFHDWSKIHIESLQGQPIPEIELLFSPIMEELPSEAEKKTVIKAGFKDVLAYLEFAMSPVCKLQFLPTVFYSNLIVAQAHTDEQLAMVKKHMETNSSSIEIPEEFKKKLNI